jgi:hypothetical protein
MKLVSTASIGTLLPMARRAIGSKKRPMASGAIGL